MRTGFERLVNSQFGVAGAVLVVPVVLVVPLVLLVLVVLVVLLMRRVLLAVALVLPVALSGTTTGGGSLRTCISLPRVLQVLKDIRF